MAAVAGIVALGTKGMGSRWPLLILGLLFVAATDAAYALQVIKGVYAVGTPLDAGFAIGLALIAFWVDSAQRPGDSTGQQASPVTGGAALTVSSVATVAGLGVLVVGTRTNVSTLAVSLATVTLLAAAARTQLSYRQLAWMADLRSRAAATDDLTGIPNRRALYDMATRLQTVEDLRTALTNDQLGVHYQPKINLDTGDVHGVEALVRWDHPTEGLLYPDAFLHLIEESRLMPTLTRIVLTQALDQAARWQSEGRHLTVSVNLSASSLTDTDLPQQIATMLTSRGVPPSALQLEITEEFLMADRDQAHDILAQLRRTGIQISIDDYGTGYSSLSYLRDLPIDELKLDRSFIFPMADDARAAALVAATVTMAHHLGLRMVAEGVETTVAITELTRLGCDEAQGYLMSRPVPAAELDHRRPVHQGTGIPEARPTAALG